MLIADMIIESATLLERLARSPASAHDLYKTGDPDAPDSIKDRNGEVVLGLCRRCRKGECELTEPCTAPSTPDFERECDDADKICAALGLTVEQARTEGGSLNVPKILNHIQETLDALKEASAFGAAMVNRRPAPKCDPTLTECPRCHNDASKCDGVFKDFRPAAIAKGSGHD